MNASVFFALSCLVMLLVQIVPTAYSEPLTSSTRSVAEEIRFEATLSDTNDLGHPLPLAAHWNTGERPNGFDPAYQISLIEQGHYLLPWFQFPSGKGEPDVGYYKIPLQKAAKLGLPISFLGTQWEHLLTDDPAFRKLPPDQNPNVVTPWGSVLNETSPFGPVWPWRAAGRQLTNDPVMKKIEEWYPDPPLVLFISNNEQKKLQWNEVLLDKRYIENYGILHDDNFKRELVGNAWVQRYRALFDGMREGLLNSQWKNKSIFVGYDAFGSSAFARWDGWLRHSLYVPGRIEPWPLAWDGASVSFYVNNWDSSTDYTVMSPEIASMNWIFMIEEARRLNPNFWFEISTWDGHEPSKLNDKRKYYAEKNQRFSPARYGGMVQYGMWLLRPRVVREFRLWSDTLQHAGPYFWPIVEAVDRVHINPVLRKFWRKGQLVANKAHLHPYQSQVPKEYEKKDRWFLLDTNLDPKRPWNLETPLPIFSLALVIGNPPEREWLIYAFAPLGTKENVKITIPDYRVISIPILPEWGFYHVLEKTAEIVRLDNSEQAAK